MSKARDILGKSGAGGLGPIPASQSRPISSKPADQKSTKKAASNAPRGGQQQGGGKAPVARRPKV